MAKTPEVVKKYIVLGFFVFLIGVTVVALRLFGENPATSPNEEILIGTFVALLIPLLVRIGWNLFAHAHSVYGATGKVVSWCGVVCLVLDGALFWYWSDLADGSLQLSYMFLGVFGVFLLAVGDILRNLREYQAR